MKTAYSNPVEQQGEQGIPYTPKWVSLMGLEWLYKLLLNLELPNRK